ncbi:hypothetical protein INT47_008620 [Mucor saturninus]|uniref:Protein kinase domain-containing protein n=1 Tax=Mucor saturninus TaxID=64648 RepID=A0A8H7UTY8_9FUNG|nr:hypothetical protein INT47_008620 [Mucor saturninus]
MTTVTASAPIQFTEPTLSRNRSFQQQQQQQQQKRYHTQHIGNYVIHKKTLGSGSMGTVKLAECLSDRDHQQYAVKIMPKINLALVVGDEKNKDPKDTPREREQRTIREMAIMHLLRHPNICQLKEWVVQGDHYYMFLEYIEGGQLLDYIISHGKLREKLARKFARQIASALDYCHRNSIVHRDLKIENILITNHEEIKIIDFGLSNIYSPSRLLNTFCGSLYFAAPELLQARNYTGPEVDVWSFGVVLYVLVCGRVPFDDTSLPALHQKIKAGVVEYPDHLTKECIDLLSKILVVDPKKRETLSFVIHHPWMNRGYDEPIFNHLPHRQPLKCVDPQVIAGMQGFGLGSPHEIQSKLEKIISSTQYQTAAQQIDQNYQQQQKSHTPSMNDNTNSLTRWRRTISIKRSSPPTLVGKDDPQSLPAMYDPLISIYALVKERRDFDEKVSLLQSGGYQSPVQLGRSASTSLTTPSHGINSEIRRRKTERVPPSHTRHLFKDTTDTVDWAAPHVNDPKKLNTGGTTILQRSRSAAKRIGAMLPSKVGGGGQGVLNEDVFHVIERQKSRDSLPPPAAASSSGVELNYSSSLKKKTIHLLRSSSLSDKQRRQQKKTMDEDVHGGASSLVVVGGRLMEEGLTVKPPTMSTHPKSLFNFSRRHLFKMTTTEMLKNIQHVLLKLGIQYRLQEGYTFKCELSDWARFTRASSIEMEDEGVVDGVVCFTLMIYQARWAGGRLGVKVLEAEEKDDKMYRQIYHTILNELDSF